jgi:hypothetical protein
MYAGLDIPWWGIDVCNILLPGVMPRFVHSMEKSFVRYSGFEFAVLIDFGYSMPKIYDDLIVLVVPVALSHRRLLSPHPVAGYPPSMAHRDVLAA